MFVLNHEGRWVAEVMLDKEWPEILYEYNVNNAGTRIQAASLFAVTRKHHSRELPNQRAITRLLDEFDAADEDEQIEFSASLHAALTGASKKELIEDYRKRQAEAELPEDELEEEEPGEDEEDEAPKDSEPSETTTKSTGSSSAAGKGSSKKQ